MDGIFRNASDNLKPARVETKGSSPVILAVPHRGFEVPDHLRNNDGKPLGMPYGWFALAHPQTRRHEVSDWGIGGVVANVYNNNENITVVSTDISRLVVDVDRIRHEAIVDKSEDTGESIIGNTDLSRDEKEVRLRAYYDPYHAALDQTVSKAKLEFGGAIVIHPHAFAKEYKKAERPFTIGTIYPEENNPLAEMINAALYQHEGVNFAPRYPYDLRQRPVNVMHDLSRRQQVWNVGIEINQDVLLSPQGTARMSSLLTRVIDDVRRSKDFQQLLRYEKPQELQIDPTMQLQPPSIVLPAVERVM
jgi:predicted N-formylglutamate amidohydrolase